MTTPQTQATAASAFAPFKYRIFTVLWMATLISNIGTWMFNVTSGWIMTELSPSPFMVSLVQVATALPIFIFALPAGALGDIFDRRKLLLVTQIASAAALFIFAAILWAGHVSAWGLLLFTFLTGAGSAFAMPAWQAIVPRLVAKEALQPAIALNGVSVNIARAIGPALGGFILVAAGATATVLFDAVTYLFVAAALLWWRASAGKTDTLPREHMAGAMRAGLRFSLRSQALRSTIIRALAFFTFASAYWALLPLIAKELLHGGPGLYGIILTALGAGAVAGTFLIGKLRKQLGANAVVALGTLGTALAMGFFAYGGNATLGVLAGVLAGLSWIMVISSLNVSAQTALPDWVRARGLAIFQMMFWGAMTAGSLLWGKLAMSLGLPHALILAAAISLLCIPLTWRFKLNLGEHDDFVPSGHWPEPVLSTPVAHDRGPVLVSIEYHIRQEDSHAMHHLMRELGALRRRDGAVHWGVFEDVARPGTFIEIFIEESWVAHMRQHLRVSGTHKQLQEKIRALHQGDAPPIVRHAVTPEHGADSIHLPEDHHD